jgi:hypothetical protein
VPHALAAVTDTSTGDVKERRDVERIGLRSFGAKRMSPTQEVHSSHHFVERSQTKTRHQLTHLFCDEEK